MGYNNAKWNKGLLEYLLNMKPKSTLRFVYLDSEGKKRVKKIKCLTDKENAV